MIDQIYRLCIGGLITLVGTSANANLITNGSFENPDVRTGSWSHFSSTDVPGWNGSRIEIWDHLFGEAAYDGDQFAELNSHPTQNKYRIYQDVATDIGQTYDLSFAYQARRGESYNERFQVSLIGLLSQELNDHTRNGWSLFNTQFVATSNSTRLEFLSLNRGTYGNLIDDVRITAAEVPEPSVASLLALGMIGLGIARKRLLSQAPIRAQSPTSR